MRHGGKILIDQLEAQGATTAFTVPGESFLAALDGLHDSNRIKTIICRQEGGASMMAEAWGKITGEPGICFVTRGPGAANAMSGLHVAQQDSTPMVAFVGMPARGHEDREAFQEIEIKQLFVLVREMGGRHPPDRAHPRVREPRLPRRPLRPAGPGRAGPARGHAGGRVRGGRCQAAPASPSRASGAEDMAAAAGRSSPRPQRPLMIVGGPGWSTAAQKAMEAFADRFDLPVAPAFRYQDYFDNRHRCYVGCAGIGIDPKLAAAIKDADLLIVVGARLGEMTTSGYTLLDIPNPAQFLVHIHPSPDELGSVYRPDLPIAATARTLRRGARPARAAGARSPGAAARAELRAAYERSLKPIPLPGAVKMADVMRTVSEMLPENGIVTNGAGNFAAFVHRYFEYKGYRTCLAPDLRLHGLRPAGGHRRQARASRRGPSSTCRATADFLMTGQELATAVQYALPIVTIIANNGMYGTIRAHQEREYPAPRRRHDARQSGLRGLRAQLRRRRLHHRGDGRLRARLPRRAGEQQALRHRAQARSRGALAAQDADRPFASAR